MVLRNRITERNVNWKDLVELESQSYLQSPSAFLTLLTISSTIYLGFLISINKNINIFSRKYLWLAAFTMEAS